MLQRLVDAAAVEAEIERVRSLSGAALRRRWQSEFGRPLPRGLTIDLLRRMIANRIQEEAFGTLDRATLKLLDGLARRDRARGLCLGGHLLFQPVGDRAGDYRDGLERPAFFRRQVRPRKRSARARPPTRTPCRRNSTIRSGEQNLAPVTRHVPLRRSIIHVTASLLERLSKTLACLLSDRRPCSVLVGGADLVPPDQPQDRQPAAPAAH